MRVPFQERNSRWRGVLDVVSGRYPGFLFGGGLGRWLPVFHFHESHPAALEPYFQYLVENGYRTVDSAAIADLVRRGRHPGDRTVAICFDDAWSSMWLTVFPLLKRYGLQAITYVSPGRVPEAEDVRRLERPASDPAWAEVDRVDPMFSTWPEIRAMAASGHVDVQAHGWRHAQVAAAGEPVGFLAPGQLYHPHEVPWVDTPSGGRFLRGTDLGAPLYPTRSRFSDVRWWRNADAFSAGTELVRREGGAAFFERPDWRERLGDAHRAAAGRGRAESAEEQRRAVLEELEQARAILNQRLGGDTVRHMCFPWAIAGRVAVSLAERAGYETAFADRLGGARSVRAGDPPHQLMRLKHAFITCLPGRGRSWFFGGKPRSASAGMNVGPLPLPAGAGEVRDGG